MSKHYTKIVFALILILALFIRFWNFNSWLGFDYDQEINAWIAKSIIIDHKLTLIGPEASVGGMYVGPFFNYLISLFFLIGKMDPAWTVILNFFISAATIVSVYLVGKKIFSPSCGVIAAVIYAFSCFAITYDRVLWNPTPIPLVSLLFSYYLYKYISRPKNLYLFLTVAFIGIAFHLHFQVIFLVGLFLLSITIFHRFQTIKVPQFLIILGTLLLFLSPLLLFDLRHHFLSTHNFLNFLLTSQQYSSDNFIRPLLVVNVFQSLLYNGELGVFKGLSFLVVVYTLIVTIRNFQANLFYKIAALTAGLILVFSLLYHGPSPIYYFLFALPIFIILIAQSLTKLDPRLITIFLTVFIAANLWEVTQNKTPFSLQFKQETIRYIITNAKTNPFKVVFVDGGGLNTGFKYLFWLEKAQVTFDANAHTEKTYKLVLPYILAGQTELTARFGGIGIVKSN